MSGIFNKQKFCLHCVDSVLEITVDFLRFFEILDEQVGLVAACVFYAEDIVCLVEDLLFDDAVDA